MLEHCIVSGPSPRPEPELEALIARLVPAAERETWTGASADKIAELQALAGRPLPAFYGWFLAKLGGSFGDAREDLRASTVLDAYRKGVVQPDPRYFLIGRNPDPIMPGLMFYDLDAPCRDDARVVSRLEAGPPWEQEFETFREELAWGLLLEHRVITCPQVCSGNLIDDGGDIFGRLDPVMARLGFTSPIETGAFCGLYERADAAMTCMSAVKDTNRGLQFFRLGGPDSVALRRILGEIATGSTIEVSIGAWTPPLPG